jgi:hypothetical protein
MAHVKPVQVEQEDPLVHGLDACKLCLGQSGAELRNAHMRAAAGVLWHYD